MVVAGAMGLQTPSEGIDLWIAKLKQEGYSPRTIELYKRTVEIYLAQDPTPSSLSIRSYIAYRLSTTSPAWVSIERKALKSLFTFLYEDGLWNTNPLNGVKPVRMRFRERRCPEQEDIKKLLGVRLYRRADDARFKLMVILLLDTGLRVSEAASILKKDIDFNNMEIRVIGKGDKERFVPISPFTCALVRQYMETYCTDDSLYLYPAPNKNGYWDVLSLEKTMRGVCRKLGIKPITPHQLRHYFATTSLRNGAKLEVISRMLGHASVGITADIYRHVKREEMKEEHRLYCPLSQMAGFLPEGGTNAVPKL